MKKTTKEYKVIDNKKYFVKAGTYFIDRCSAFLDSEVNEKEMEIISEKEVDAEDNRELYRTKYRRRHGVAEISEDERRGLQILLKRHIIDKKLEVNEIVIMS